MRDKGLYETDVLTWSKQQADALRRLAELELAPAVDWSRVVEEIEEVGRAELRRVHENAKTAMVHLLSGYCDPDSLSRMRWSIETSRELRSLRNDFTESMRTQLDLNEIWQDAFDSAVQVVSPDILEVPPSIPATCPFVLDDLLDESFTYDSGLRALYDLLTAPRQQMIEGLT